MRVELGTGDLGSAQAKCGNSVGRLPERCLAPSPVPSSTRPYEGGHGRAEAGQK